MSVDAAGRRRLLSPAGLLTLAAVILVAVGAGVGALVPVFSMAADTQIASMLPAGTVFYLTADLNPTGSTRANLERIERAYTGQPGWSHIQSEMTSAEDRSKDSSSCARDASSQITDHLGDLGHDSAIALTSARGIKASDLTGSASGANGIPASLRKYLVILLPINAHRTLLQVLTGSSMELGFSQKATTYDGITINRQSFETCRRATRGTANTIYTAQFDNWVAAGFTPDAIVPVIDTAHGRKPSLASSATYRTLMAKLPANQLASYFVDGKALARAGLLSATQSLSTSALLPASTYAAAAQPSAGALTVDGSGFVLTAATPRSSLPQQPADTIASLLPADVEGLISVQGVKGGATSVMAQLRKSGLVNADAMKTVGPIVADLTADLAGEADLVMFKPVGVRMTASDPSSIPLALLWQVRSSESASAHLDDVVRRLGQTRSLRSGTAADGTAYYTVGGSYGYAVRKGWAIAALNVKQALSALATDPPRTLAHLPAYGRATTRGERAASVWYLDVTGLRTSIEAAALPTMDATSRADYTTTVKPWFAPIRTISGSVGTDGGMGVSTMRVDISAP